MTDNPDFSSHWVRVQGLNVHYKCFGTGPTLMLLHGNGNDWREWHMNLAFLAQSFRVYALDLPGFGFSDVPNTPVTPRWFSSFLGNLMETLGITDTHLVGHSLGGVISLAFALDFPERVNRIIIVDSAGLGQLSQKGRLLVLLAGGLRRAGRILGRGKGPEYKTGGTMQDWLFTDSLPKLKLPVMILWGEKDPYLPVSQARLAQNLIPNSQLYVFPGCHHAPQRECSGKFNSLVYEFLSEC